MQFRTATLIILGIVVISAIIVAAWFSSEGTISGISVQISNLPKNPPMWLQAPMVTGRYLLAPTVVMFLTVLAVMFEMAIAL